MQAQTQYNSATNISYSLGRSLPVDVKTHTVTPIDTNDRAVYDCFGRVSLPIDYNKYGKMIVLGNLTVKYRPSTMSVLGLGDMVSKEKQDKAYKIYMMNLVKESKEEYVEFQKKLDEIHNRYMQGIETMSHILVAQWLRTNDMYDIESR